MNFGKRKIRVRVGQSGHPTTLTGPVNGICNPIDDNMTYTIGEPVIKNIN
jgi:hypothetical protein